MRAGIRRPAQEYWSFVQWKGTCLIRSLCGFESRSSDQDYPMWQETQLQKQMHWSADRRIEHGEKLYMPV